MKRNYSRKSCLALGTGIAVMASALLWSTPLIASDYSFSGESNTIFRMRKTIDKKNLFPAYEYLRLNMTDNRSDGSGVSFYFGAWGRADLRDKSSDSSTDAELQYAYLTYRAPKNNTVVSIGRQFISEGVAAEQVDGLYLRNDFAYGIGTAAFFGNSVITEPTYQGGTTVYGTRVSQTDKKYYTVGLSALKSEYDNNSRYREEEGLDLWVRPLQQVDLTGRSSYNSITNGWMEHSYAVSYAPFSTLRFGTDFSRINFKDYMATVTTAALSVYNPVLTPFLTSKQEQTAVGVKASYTGIKNLAVAADYKFYSYNQTGDASYFGGKASYTFPEELLIGAGFHRMDGETDKLRYLELRAFASKKIGHADLTVDGLMVSYDKDINGIKNSYSITGAAGYEVNQKLKIGADIEYSKNPDFDNELRALVKAIYTFDTKFAAEGGSKSEK
ncbi:MAG: hypothetical protein PHI31_07380 [Desulfuromonadaceae bacterium]|nr:hypothetical protein [Desulfuromonadaceae bacterium]